MSEHPRSAEGEHGLGAVLAEQRRYYRDRAGEYEDWWFRRGRYDRGRDANRRWFAETAALQALVDAAVPQNARVLELACGTGLWTERLAQRSESLTAIDASEEMLALARAKIDTGRAHFELADIFAWEPRERYDVCFFGFWLSHVPAILMGEFWEKVGRALARGGRALFVDSARSEHASAVDHRLQERGEELMTRRLDDGREYRIVKHWFDPLGLERMLAALGWSARVSQSGEFFVWGQAALADG